MSNTTDIHDLEQPAENAGATEAVSASREPVRAPEGVVAPSVAAEDKPVADEQKPAQRKFLGITLPKPMSHELDKANQWGARWRRGAIEKAPRHVVNNSSNIMGLIQICAELFMFKSSGMELLDTKKPHHLLSQRPWQEKPFYEKALHVVYDPARNIMDTVFQKGGLGSTHPLQIEFYKQLPQRIKALPSQIAKIPESLAKIPSHLGNLPETVVSSFKRLGDTGAATIASRTNQAGAIQKLTNKWSARSTFCGIFAWSLVAAIPDKKDTPEETEKNAIMAKDRPITYVAKRVYQALNPLEWWNHKRQLGGLGALCSGTFSFISGFRQVAGTEIGHQMFMRNGWQTLGGAITATSGGILLLAIDNDSGYRNFGAMQLLRTFTLPNAIYTRFKGINMDKAKSEGAKLDIEIHQKLKEQGAAQYLIGSALLNGKNFFAASVGGAEVDENGNIVDHTAMRKEGREKAKSGHHTKSQQLDRTKENGAEVPLMQDTSIEEAKPQSRVSHVKDVAPAMPQRQAEEAVAV